MISGFAPCVLPLELSLGSERWLVLHLVFKAFAMHLGVWSVCMKLDRAWDSCRFMHRIWGHLSMTLFFQGFLYTFGLLRYLYFSQFQWPESQIPSWDSVPGPVQFWESLAIFGQKCKKKREKNKHFHQALQSPGISFLFPLSRDIGFLFRFQMPIPAWWLR